MTQPKIVSINNGFAIVAGGIVDAVSFDDVRAIVAYRLDEVTSDLLCCDIITGSVDDEQIRTIHEDIPGFEATMTRCEVLPGFDKGWRAAALRPQGVKTRMTIYHRTASAS